MAKSAPKSSTDPVEVHEVEEPVHDTPKRTSVQRVVYKQVEGEATVGRFLTVIVMGDQTVTLEVDVPKEVAADVAAALVALESPLYVIQSAD